MTREVRTVLHVMAKDAADVGRIRGALARAGMSPLMPVGKVIPVVGTRAEVASAADIGIAELEAVAQGRDARVVRPGTSLVGGPLARVRDRVGLVQLPSPTVLCHLADEPSATAPNATRGMSLKAVRRHLGLTKASPTGRGVRIAVVDSGLRCRFGRDTRPNIVLGPSLPRGSDTRADASRRAPPARFIRQPWDGIRRWSDLHPALRPGLSGTYRIRGALLDDDKAIGHDLDADEIGHGTAVVAHIHAIAPHAQITMVKAFDRRPLHNTPLLGLATALQLHPAPDIILCAWAPTVEGKVLTTYLDAAHQRGILVVCASGNGRMSDKTSVKPITDARILSVGGAWHRDGNLEASQLTSSFRPTQPPGRQVPDVVGLAGQVHGDDPKRQPDGVLTPTAPASLLDQRPDAEDDWLKRGPANGWHRATGSSIASAQAAGLAACVRSATGLAGAELRQAVIALAKDVPAGRSASGDAASPGPDHATGHGLVHLGKLDRLIQRLERANISSNGRP